MVTLLKNQIFVDVFLIEDYGYAALRKKLLIVPFVERCKTANLGKPYKFYQYLKQFPSALFLNLILTDRKFYIAL